MAVDAATAAGVGSTAAQNAANAAKTQEIAGNFQQFLTLLTTQLKNQSPLDPLDTNQFTQQLVQFAGVEQQLKTNDQLSTLIAASAASTAVTAAGLVGQTVTLDGAQSTFESGAAKWSINADKASTATVTITDSTGTLIANQTKTLVAGDNTFSWDGRALNGNTVQTGTFKISVTAKDAAGQTVKTSTDVKGQVDSVDLSGTVPMLLVGDRKINVTAVKSIGG